MWLGYDKDREQASLSPWKIHLFLTVLICQLFSLAVGRTKVKLKTFIHESDFFSPWESSLTGSVSYIKYWQNSHPSLSSLYLKKKEHLTKGLHNSGLGDNVQNYWGCSKALGGTNRTRLRALLFLFVCFIVCFRFCFFFFVFFCGFGGFCFRMFCCFVCLFIWFGVFWVVVETFGFLLVLVVGFFSKPKWKESRNSFVELDKNRPLKIWKFYHFFTKYMQQYA